LEELEASAVRENEEILRGTFALIGFLLGAVATYGLLKLYAADWSKVVRFIALFAGACSSAFIFARLAVALRKMFAIALTVGVPGGIGYFVWKVL
jgi:hypothetical protein